MGKWSDRWFSKKDAEAAEAKFADPEVVAAIRQANGSDSAAHLHYLQVTTVLACARVIAEGLAQVPCKLVRDADDGGKEEARDHPLFELLYGSPNDFQTSYEFRETVGLNLTLFGNAYVFVSRDSSGRPIELLPFDNGLISVTFKDWQPTYRLAKVGKVPAENIWHIKGPSLNGWEGLNATKNAREAINLAMKTQEFGSKLFENGSMPGGVLSTDDKLTIEQMRSVKEMWEETMAGDNQLKLAVMHGGFKYQATSVQPDNAQFLETRKLQIEEICRAYRVNPIKVFHNDGSVSYGSLEQTNIAHLTDTLAPLFERFEQSARKALLTAEERAAGYQIKLNSRGLLKASASERANYYTAMRSAGIMTANECRAAEDMPLSSDPTANELKPAANLFGNPTKGVQESNPNE